MYPFSEAELERVYARAVERLRAAGHGSRLADLLLIAAWTGLRWSELRAIRVRDFAEVPMPLLVVQRAEPEGTSVKGTKSGQDQTGAGGRPDPAAGPRPGGGTRGRGTPVRDLLGAPAARLRVQAHARTGRTLAEGRRIHDLRHTAACLWLARGVDPVTVQSWMGHASIATTNLYLHHLGTSADRTGSGPAERPGARPGHA